MKLFNAYKPVIEKNGDIVVSNTHIITGDINGDGKEDCIVSFERYAKGAVNPVSREYAIYLNMGSKMKVAGSFPPTRYCFVIDHIKDQVIYAVEHECVPIYASLKKQHRFIYTAEGIQEFTTRKFIPDDFPVTNRMFGSDLKGDGREIKSGPVRSIDKVWFSNDTLRQTLVYELYTDYTRMDIFLFSNDNIPKGLIERMELHTAEGYLAGENEKISYFKGFIRKAKKIRLKYFTSNKGFTLGSKKGEIVSAYGRPDKVSVSGGIQTLEWEFPGDILYDGKSDLHKERLAADSFGHQATMFFKDEKLIGLVLHNDIP